jgi:hypothetical protein
MGMVGTIREVKRDLWHRHGIEPSGFAYGQPLFENIPDGTYTVNIEGRERRVKLTNNAIHILEDKKK